jgi:protein phosphatase
MSDAKLIFAGRSDPGRVREHNEDRIAWRADLGFAVLADGMGGHHAGEVASEMTVTSIADELSRALGETPLACGGDDDGTEAVYLCMSSIEQANALVYQAAQADPLCKGMGTTVVLALCAPECVTVAHVGDSRAYLLRDARLEQVTRDHSMVQDAVHNGLFTLEEAQRVFAKNLISRAVGIGADVEVDVQQVPARGGDVWLLCSDGLSDLVSDAELALTIVNFGANLDEAARRLVRMANERGGHDNISVVLIGYRDGARNTAG